MASIDKRPDGKWRARWREYPGGPQRTKHFGRRRDAEAFLDTIRGDLRKGTYVDPSDGRIKLKEFAEKWREMQVHRPSTAALVETNLRRHVYPQLGDRELRAIRPSDIQAWVKGRQTELKPATVELVYRYLSSVFRSAVDDRLIASSPCVRITLPRKVRPKVVPLQLDQVRTLTEAMPDRYRALVTLGAGTGVRQGEAFGLTVDRVDFLRRTLTVDRQLLLLPHGGPELAPPKTDSSVRTIPVPQVVIDALSRHLAMYPAEPDGLIFTNDQGNPIRRTRFSDVWRPAAKVAGIEPGTGYHALRHFYASLLIRHGESVKVVQARLGHASAVETLETYAHLWPDSEDRTRAAVDLAFAGDQSSKPAVGS